MALGKSLFSGIWIVEKELCQNLIVCQRVKWIMGQGSTMVQEAKPSQGTTNVVSVVGRLWVWESCRHLLLLEKAYGVRTGRFLEHFPLTVVQLLSRVWLFVTPLTAARQASLSFIISQSLLRLMSIEPVMPSNHLILCHPLLLPPSIFPRVFPNELALQIRWPKYWSISFINDPSNEYSGLISFRIDWFDLLAIQGTLKSLLQNHNSKASVL